MGHIAHVNIVTNPYLNTLYGENIHMKNRILSEFTLLLIVDTLLTKGLITRRRAKSCPDLFSPRCLLLELSRPSVSYFCWESY